MDEKLRDDLGRVVREAWVKWAQAQPRPKVKWLLPYDQIVESEREADRQIGEAVYNAILGADGPRPANPPPIRSADVRRGPQAFEGVLYYRDEPMGAIEGTISVHVERSEDGRNTLISYRGEFGSIDARDFVPENMSGALCKIEADGPSGPRWAMGVMVTDCTNEGRMMFVSRGVPELRPDLSID